jgi:hypothetical protein
MPVTNIESLGYNDPQNLSIDKINNNFDEIVEFHGGTQGLIGPTGNRGEIGQPGDLGATGGTGARGTRWFVQSVQPSGPETTVVNGDFWVDSDNGNIFEFSQSGWVFTGYSISSSSNVFDATSSAWAGGTGTSIILDQVLPENYLFILADKVSSSGILNETLSKFMVSTDSTINDSPLLEFSKSNLEDGSLTDYSQHPVFKWKSPSPNDNSLLLQIPGGSFVVGASGGFEGLFQTLNINSAAGLSIDYGTSPGSGIFSTGGFFFNSPSGTFSIESNFLNITGGSGNFDKPILLNANLQSGVPSLLSLSGNSPGALQTSRSGDSFQALSHTVYNLSLENSGGRELGLDTKGKLLTKKYETGISYAETSPGATSTVGSNQVNWYFISRSGTTVSSAVLDFGNTIVITPNIPLGNYVGVGVYSDSAYSWTGTGGIEGGQSIDINVLFSPNTFETGISDGIKYIGAGATSGNATSYVTLPFNATSVDLTVSKGPTGNSTTVFYRAYGSAGGSGGSFLI